MLTLPNGMGFVKFYFVLVCFFPFVEEEEKVLGTPADPLFVKFLHEKPFFLAVL